MIAQCCGKHAERAIIVALLDWKLNSMLFLCKQDLISEYYMFIYTIITTWSLDKNAMTADYVSLQSSCCPNLHHVSPWFN